MYEPSHDHTEAFQGGSELTYRKFIEMTSQGYWFIAPDFKSIDVNQSLCRMLNYEKDEMIGKSIFDFVNDNNKAIFLNSVTKMTEQEHRNYEIALQKKDGEEINCQFNATTVWDQSGNIEGSFAFITDISERKRAEAELKSSQRQLADIINFLPDATLVINREGQVIAWNREVEKMTGYKAEDMLGKGNYEYSKAFYKGDRRPIIVDLVLLPKDEIEKEYYSISRDGDILRGESTVTVVRGEKRHLSAWARPLYDASGQIIGAIECIRDITELEEYRKHLEKMIEHRTEELKQAKEVAESAASAKSEFLANMSHEIRTPMNAIIGFSGLALKTELTAKQYDYVKKIEISAKSLLGIINDILDFSKIEAGRMELESIEFNLDDVMNNIINLVAIEGTKKGLEILSNIRKDVPHALIGDPLRLGQVLINLVNNAVKFTENGSILIMTELQWKDTQSCVIKFSVKDTGIGLSQNQIERLFTAFTQADSSVTRKFGGTGLGLTISKHLVEMMGGQISVESTPSQGSIFSFTASFARQSVENEQINFSPADLTGLKVLIVDDNNIAREVLAEQIKSLNFQTVSVESGKQAIAELQRAASDKPFDLVLMDWKMPELDGIETAEMIFQDANLNQTPLIFMVSAFGREEVIQKAEKVGVHSFLMKPVNQSLLFDTIMQSFAINGSEMVERRSIPPSPVSMSGNFAGVNVLLVEDNELNQQVATEILKGMGMSVAVANNGKNALDAMAAATYDLVLMDVQMPVMGGYEATRLLRNDKNYADIPIIAMTAHAMHGAKEECLEAGMNDYISKPIDPDQLYTVIARWITPQATDQIPSPIPQDSVHHLPESLSGIDIKTGLQRLNGNESLYARLLFDFHDKYSSAIEDIHHALDQEDFETAVRFVHTLKGVAGNLSIPGVYGAARNIEDTMVEKYKGSKLEIDQLLVTLDHELLLVNQSLNELKINLDAAPIDIDPSTPPLNVNEIAATIVELAKLLDEDNIDAIHSLESLKKQIRNSIFKPEIMDLEKQINNYDFDAAKKSLQSLAQALNLEKR
jgi:two-component system sensor histidine kinase/response regulator